MSKFKAGDRVQLIAYPSCTGIILKISDDGCLARVNMDVVGECDYFTSVIQLVEEPKVESKFKVGDKVRVVLTPYVKGVIAEVNNELLEIFIQEYGTVTYHSSKIELEEKTVDYEHYNYWYKGVKLDPYRILDIYKITCPAQQHAIKKLLRAGNSVKELKQDITEVIDTLKRKLEMLEEDSDNP